ncbi:MAG TPA: PQQ-binding-like beta-propeller repeat protein [Bryobacteraceae bacterium]|jgi:outer membrane protein assembly factor BamB
MASSAVFIGVRGSVVALDRATGQQLWRTFLTGSDFTNVLLDEDRVMAATKGELFCVDAATGKLLWRNQLPGMGWGLITIATASGSTGVSPAAREKSRRDEAGSEAALIAAS